MKKVIFITGAGHCGSTLVDLILGSHSQAFSLGEFWSASRYLDKRDDESLAMCGICSDECSFWDKQVSRKKLKAHFRGFNSKNKYILHLSRRYGSVQANIYQHLFDVTNAQVLIDSSKPIPRIKRQLFPFWQWRQMKPYLLYITRDGRAITNSYLRKYPERGMDHFASQWKTGTLEREAYFETFPEAQRYQLAYEDITTKPEVVVQELCRWLDLPYEPGMLQYWQQDHHMIAGNLGPRLLIFKYREQFGGDEIEHWSEVNKDDKYVNQSYYDQLGLTIRMDLRWKEELSAAQLDAFEAAAGDVNQRYAYEPENT